MARIDLSRRRVRSGAAALLVPALVFSVALNVALASRAGAQRVLIEEIRRQYTPLRNQTVPGFTARTLEGEPMRIEYGEVDVPTVLYFFQPRCEWCRRNHRAFEALVAGAAGRFRVLAVSLDREGLEGFLAQHPTTATVLADIDSHAVAAYDAGGTPQTMVISREGTVLENWRGVFTGDQRRQAEARLGVALPEIEEAKDGGH
jgi:peroxiredoxin